MTIFFHHKRKCLSSTGVTRTLAELASLQSAVLGYRVVAFVIVGNLSACHVNGASLGGEINWNLVCQVVTLRGRFGSGGCCGGAQGLEVGGMGGIATI